MFWAFRKKTSQPSGPAALDTDENSTNVDTHSCSKFTVRWIVTMVLSLQLLVFILVSVAFHGKSHRSGLSAFAEAPLIATFKLQRSATVIKNYQPQLEANLLSQIKHPGSKVIVASIDQIHDKKWAEVYFTLVPDPSNRTFSHEEIEELKGNFVKVFLKDKNITLTSSTFGRVIDFQIERFKGGITIVPQPSDKSLSHRSSLFNFTLLNSSLTTLDAKFGEFKRQLTDGLCLSSHENLIMRFTNLNGSTVGSPVIVQTSVFRSLGHHLPLLRLKQLAQHVTRQHSRNLGLNHTMFGKVRDLQLSSVLAYSLGHSHAPSPSPSPSPSSSSSSSSASSSTHYFRKRRRRRHSLSSSPSPSPSPSPSSLLSYDIGPSVGFGESFPSTEIPHSHQSSSCVRRGMEMGMMGMGMGMIVLVASTWV